MVTQVNLKLLLFAIIAIIAMMFLFFLALQWFLTREKEEPKDVQEESYFRKYLKASLVRYLVWISAICIFYYIQ